MDGTRLGGTSLGTWPQAASLLPLHPALLALAATTRISVNESKPWGEAGPWIVCEQPGRLSVSPDLAGRPEGPASMRFGLEFAWLIGLPGLTLDAALLLAARAAGGFIRCLQAGRRVQDNEATALLDVFDGLAGTRPAGADLLRAAAVLRATGIAGTELPPAGGGEPNRTLAQAALLWNLGEACEMLLVSGGDDRLRIDRQTGMNRYGCTPWPAPDQIAFASSTASCISARGQAAAEALRQRLVAEALAGGDGSACIDRQTEAASASVLRHFGVAGLAGAVLTASGTDAALVVTRLLQAEHPADAMTSILMSPAETGSGVPEAVCARHFADCTASGEAVCRGAALDQAAAAPDLRIVSLREEDGTPRSRDGIAEGCAAAIAASIARGRAVLHAIDGSKSGLAAPDRDGCAALARRYGDRLDIVIDACQARIEPALVRFYLEHGFPVLVTGSKFFGAPGFCGAVLFPAGRLRRIEQHGRLAPVLDAYASISGGVLQRRCPGLLLRWASALEEMQRFSRVPTAEIRGAIERFGQSVRKQVMAAPHLSLLAAPRPAGAGWSGRRSVFTFAVHVPGAFLSPAKLRPLYKALAAGDAGPPCLIGQPVEVGPGGLRVALSAGQIASGEDQHHGLEAVFGGLQALLARQAV